MTEPSVLARGYLHACLPSIYLATYLPPDLPIYPATYLSTNQPT